MSKPVRFAREARDEARAAASWYEEQRRGLRAEFLAALDEAIARIANLSNRLAPIPGIDPSLAVRRVYMKRFPFGVIFIDLPDRIRILAVAHNRRKPFYWRGRVEG